MEDGRQRRKVRGELGVGARSDEGRAGAEEIGQRISGVIRASALPRGETTAPGLGEGFDAVERLPRGAGCATLRP